MAKTVIVDQADGTSEASNGTLPKITTKPTSGKPVPKA